MLSSWVVSSFLSFSFWVLRTCFETLTAMEWQSTSRSVFPPFFFLLPMFLPLNKNISSALKNLFQGNNYFKGGTNRFVQNQLRSWLPCLWQYSQGRRNMKHSVRGKTIISTFQLLCTKVGSKSALCQTSKTTAILMAQERLGLVYWYAAVKMGSSKVLLEEWW